MKNGLVLFTGIFLTLFSSSAVLVFLNANHPLYGRLEPHEDEISGAYRPAPSAGLAERGRVVYAEMGCVHCHTQQVRRPTFGSDAERGWGHRQAVARDYIGQERVHLGDIRIGPDLRAVGERDVPEAWAHLDWKTYHHLHLYNPRGVVEGSIMPSFAFLYEKREILGEPSPDGLPVEVGDGYEVVPTDEAKALVYYLGHLRLDYDLPEAALLTVEAAEAAEAERAAAAEEGHDEQH